VTVNHLVVGSSPTRGAIFMSTYFLMIKVIIFVIIIIFLSLILSDGIITSEIIDDQYNNYKAISKNLNF
jgi:hypothetical protein